MSREVNKEQNVSIGDSKDFWVFFAITFFNVTLMNIVYQKGPLLCYVPMYTSVGILALYHARTQQPIQNKKHRKIFWLCAIGICLLIYIGEYIMHK
ncbi:MAG: hypothetical protein AAF639_47535, partial [Chloroflexota bacterium]